MFKFTKLFSLEHDVVPRISNDQLPPEAKSIGNHIATTINAYNANNNNNSNAQGYGNNGNNGNNITHYGSQTRGSPYLRDKLDHFKLGSSFNGVYTSSNNIMGGNNGGGSNSRYNTPPPHFIANQLQQQQQSNSGFRSNGSPLNSSPLNNSANGEDEYDEDNDFIPVESDNDNTRRSPSSSFDPSSFSGYASSSLDSANLFHYYSQHQCIAQIIDLRIIGKDNTGSFLIARNAISDGMQKTFVDKIDIYSSDKRPETLLKFCGTIISACLSNEPTKSLLIFTVKQPDKVVDVNTKNEVYSSYIHEINRKSDFHALEMMSPFPLTYHCLHVDMNKNFLYLLLIQNTECYSVKVPIHRDNNGIYLTANKKTIGKKEVIFRQFYWYQFDDITQTFYSLHYKNRTGFIGPSDNIFRSCSFQAGKLSSQVEFQIQLNLSTDKMSPNQPFPMSLISNKPEQVYQNIHVVNLNGNGLCLCHQEESNNTLIRISIYLLHLKQRIRYSIPLHSIDGGFLSIQVTRVLFDCIGNLLMVYIPGNFLQFIDCSSDHDPCFGLTLQYDLSSPIKESSSHDSSDILSTRTRPLPHTISTSIIPYYLTNHKDKNKPDQYLFDYQYGILYRFQFERESILKLFNKDSISKYSLEPGTEIKAMHLTNIHVNDSEIMVRILASVCNETSLISSDLLKEYLLGSTYKILRDNKLDHQYLQILPVTSLEGFDSSSKPRLKDLELAPITTQIPTNIAPTKKEDPNKKRLKSFQVAKPDILQRETTLATFPGFLKNFFSDFKSEESSIRKSNGSDSPLSPQKQIAPTSKIPLASNISLDGYEENPLGDIQNYSANLSDYFLQISQKESKEKLTEWANSYKNVQINVVNTLYAHLRKNIINNDSHETVSIRTHPKCSQLFRVMEKLYTAIEELSCPFPKDFFSHFTILGFYCLTRTVFLQYLQRGLFVVTTAFITELQDFYLNQEPIKMEDRHFINQVILNLKDNDKMMELLQDWIDPKGNNCILDQLILKVVSQIDDPKSETDVMGPEFETSIFMPLSSLISFLDKGNSMTVSSRTQFSPSTLPSSPSRSSFMSTQPIINPNPTPNMDNAIHYIKKHAHSAIERMLEGDN